MIVRVQIGRYTKKHVNHFSFCTSFSPQVTVFDFPTILETTEKRVGNDLLGAGPKTVEELREIHAKLKLKYAQALEEKERKAGQPPPPPSAGSQVLENAGDVFAKFKQAASPPFLRASDDDGGNKKKSASSRIMDLVTEVVEFQQPPSPMRKSSKSKAAKTEAPDLFTANSPEKKASAEEEEGEWANVTANKTTGEVTTAVGEFCIDDSEDDNDDEVEHVDL